MALRWVELLLGWLAILTSAAIAVYIYIYLGAAIPTESLKSDLLGFGAVVAVMALGVTLDSLLNWLPGRVLLGLATLAFLAITAFSFISFFFLPAFLAVATTILAFVRPYVRNAQ